MSELTDLQADLVEVKAALTAARKAVKINSSNGSVERNYATLLSEKKDLKRQINRLQGKRPRVSSADMSGN